MRKTDLSTARISRAVHDSGLDKLFEAYIEPNAKAPQLAEVLETFRRYILATRDFGQNETTILHTFDLNSLSDAEFWASILSKGSDKRREAIASVAYKWRLYSEMLPKFVELIAPDQNIFRDFEPGKEANESTFVAVVLLEVPGLTDSARIINLMKAMELLHRFIVEFYDLKESELSVALCDSGSTKEFIFSTARETARHLRSLLTATTDFFLFHKERRIEKRIEIVAKSLPILETIEAKKNILGAGKAKVLEQVVMDGIIKFLDAGALPRNFSNDERVPKALTQARRKLLTHRKEKE
jgi:hypothetical protein